MQKHKKPQHQSSNITYTSLSLSVSISILVELNAQLGVKSLKSSMLFKIQKILIDLLYQLTQRLICDALG